MGAWGAGPFENDDALDFAECIDSLDDLTGVLAECGQIPYIEADLAARVIVVAECVAALHGHPHDDLPDTLAARLASLGPAPGDLPEAARNALSSVISNSELSELWGDSGDRADYNRAVTDLIARLNRPVDDAGAMPQGSPPRKTARNASPCWICDGEMGEEFTALSITVNPDDVMSRGGSVHLACLNAALHPKYIVQDWRFDDAAIDALANEIFGDQLNG